MTTASDLVRELVPLGGDPGDVALVMDGRAVSYAELTAAIRTEAERLGPARRVRILPMRNDLDSVVGLLGALAAGHPVVVIEADAPCRAVEIGREYAEARELHPDLALLLSTSGSTGSPKLVRLSHDNVWANARSIATYLGLTPQDRAITALPLHYCYGLSVLTSHLVSGATVVLTDASVADERFWTTAQTERVTSLAGVPYTFELLECSGFADRPMPDLRYITQAGGRMDPERIRRFTRLGRKRGFDLYVMYGQTEATARMAYLPPDLAHDRPEAVGIPVPGGDFRLHPVPGAPEGTGELVYRGPNVMMGYAQCAADLALGAELEELHTGDLARQAPDGLWEICGRLDRHAKVMGLRLDLTRLEARMPDSSCLLVEQDLVHAFVTRPRSAATVRRALSAETGLPLHLVRAHQVEALPVSERGKTDYRLLREHARAAIASEPDRRERSTGPASAESLRDLYAVILGRPDASVDQSFSQLGGDSLSFVEVSTQLARRLGHLPGDWPALTPSQLAGTARRRSRHLLATEPASLLRGLAILLIVVSHTDLIVVMGGAHVLLAVAGFNLARFVLPTSGRLQRARRLLCTTATFALPAALWIGLVSVLTGDYRPSTAVFLNQALGSSSWSPDWQFWFLEVLVWTNAALAAVLVVPVLDRWLRSHPFAVAASAVAGALALRYATVGLSAEATEKYTVQGTVWCVAIGWAAAEANTRTRRCLVAAAAGLGAWGFFPGEPERYALVVGGMLVLLVSRSLQLPTALSVPLHAVAQASFWIYLTHWQVYPTFEDAGHPVAAILASLAVGLLAHHVHRTITVSVGRLPLWRPATRRPVDVVPPPRYALTRQPARTPRGPWASTPPVGGDGWLPGQRVRSTF